MYVSIIEVDIYNMHKRNQSSFGT